MLLRDWLCNFSRFKSGGGGTGGMQMNHVILGRAKSYCPHVHSMIARPGTYLCGCNRLYFHISVGINLLYVLLSASLTINGPVIVMT